MCVQRCFFYYCQVLHLKSVFAAPNGKILMNSLKKWKCACLIKGQLALIVCLLDWNYNTIHTCPYKVTCNVKYYVACLHNYVHVWC